MVEKNITADKKPLYSRTPCTSTLLLEECSKGLDSLLELFTDQNQIHLFPRTISTKLTKNGQVIVNSKEETLEYFKLAGFQDCKINAYPYWRPSLISDFVNIKNPIAPDIVMIDLDLNNCKWSMDILDRTLKIVLRRIRQRFNLPPRFTPMIVWSGNGYHIYQPIDSTILDDIDELKEYANLDKYYLPNKFLKFAEQYFTDGNSDHQHNPTVSSCLIRIPGSINSKCDKGVRVVQEWDYHRPLIEPLLPIFKKYLSFRGGAYNLDHRTSYSKYIPGNNKYRSSQIGYIWIDTLLEIPLGDYRKYVVRLIIAPYLIVVKQRPYGECVKIMMDWLSRCNCVNQLRFHAEFMVKRSLESAQRVGYKPIRLEKLQQEIPVLYDIVMKKMQNR